MTKRIILVRHGQTVSNKDELIQGQVGGELSELGLRQSEQLAERLITLEFDHIYCSDLSRTRQTLAPYLKRLKEQGRSPTVEYTELLREKSYGEYEGMSSEEYLAKVNASSSDRLGFTPPGGESFWDVKTRTAQFLKSIFEKDGSFTALIISHGGAIKSMVSTLLDEPLEDVFFRKIANCSISIIEQSDDGIVASISLNDTQHLD